MACICPHGLRAGVCNGRGWNLFGKDNGFPNTRHVKMGK